MSKGKAKTIEQLWREIECTAPQRQIRLRSWDEDDGKLRWGVSCDGFPGPLNTCMAISGGGRTIRAALGRLRKNIAKLAPSAPNHINCRCVLPENTP